MRLLSLFSIRIALSLIGITAISSVIFTLLLIGLTLTVIVPDSYRIRAMMDLTAWQFDDRLLYDAFGFNPDGFSLIVNNEQEVVYVDGVSSCEIGEVLASCAPDLVGVSSGEQFFEVDSEQWTQLVLETRAGEQIITQRGPVAPTMNLGIAVISGIPLIIAVQTIMTLIIALPIVLLLSFFFIRPLVIRLARITVTSRRFAGGDFDTRVLDRRTDEIGQLGQQFDDMADTIQKNFQTLQDLAEQNATLAKQVEATAKQNERLRLARDLHDTISQRLFSLSMMASTLPGLIDNKDSDARNRAQSIARLAEETQQDLRSLLVDLRPTAILDVGFADAMRNHVQSWGNCNDTQTDITLMLHDDTIPSVVQDTLYRITVEALNNVAKHANAKQVTVTVIMGHQQIALSIVDDGQGFDSENNIHAGSLGIYGMRERTRSIGGELQIDSSDEGTSVQLIIAS